MALARSILGKFLGVGSHFFPPPLDVSTFTARCLHFQRRERPPAAEGGTLRGREMFRQIWPRIRFPRSSRDLLHAANLRHGTDGFTSPPKEGVLRIFFALKNPTASAGFEPANLGTKGQRATSRPPDPLIYHISYHFMYRHVQTDGQACPIETLYWLSKFLFFRYVINENASDSLMAQLSFCFRLILHLLVFTPIQLFVFISCVFI